MSRLTCQLCIIAAIFTVFGQNYANPINGDIACLEKNGICQNETWCGGAYQTGLCSGPASRRCCVPPKPVCTGVNIVTRAEWGAHTTKGSSALSQFPVPDIFVHHTAGTYCDTADKCKPVVKGIQNFHMETRGWNDIGYSFLVGGDGTVFEGRGWFRTGAHTKGYNSRSLAFSIMGNYEIIEPTSASLNAIKTMIACGVSKGYIKGNYTLSGHRDVGDTACPGKNVYKIIKTWPHYSHTPAI